MKKLTFLWDRKKYSISDGQMPLIISEAGVNHNGSERLARKLIDESKKVGADLVKFQTFNPNQIATSGGKRALYINKSLKGRKKTWLEILEGLALPIDSFKNLFDYCKRKKIIFLSTPYDFQSADILEKIGAPIFKIASTDVTNTPLIKYIAKKGKPVIISSGLSTLDEIKDAVHAARKAGNNKLIVLQCTSNYPASIEAANIKVISSYRQMFDTLVGYSDHTIGDLCAVLAVAEGAVIFEKHLTLNKKMSGPDHSASAEPSDMKKYIDAVRNAYIALGNGVKTVTPEEQQTKNRMQKSLTSTRNIKKGQIISKKDVLIRRPATGISPSKLENVLGKPAAKNIGANLPIKTTDIAW